MSLAASVIVPTRNRASTLALTLPRLLAQQLPADSWELLLADDGSTDETAAIAEQCAAPPLRRLPGEHAGPATARNRALAVARGEVVVFADDDVFVRADFVAAHLAAHREGPPAMVSGPIITATQIPDADARVRPPLGYHRNALPTCNGSLPRAALERAGGFDAGFSEYGWEDMELALRLRADGLSRRFAWAAPTWHYKPAGVAPDFACRLRLERERGAIGAHFYRRHPTFAVACLTKLWWPMRVADAALGALLGLDAQVERGLEGSAAPGALSPAKRKLLLLHAEIAAGSRALRRNRAARE